MWEFIEIICMLLRRLFVNCYSKCCCSSECEVNKLPNNISPDNNVEDI